MVASQIRTVCHGGDDERGGWGPRHPFPAVSASPLLCVVDADAVAVA